MRGTVWCVFVLSEMRWTKGRMKVQILKKAEYAMMPIHMSWFHW